MESPYLRIFTQLSVVMLKAASKLGFTPASRPRTKASRGFAEPVEDAGGEGR